MVTRHHGAARAKAEELVTASARCAARDAGAALVSVTLSYDEVVAVQRRADEDVIVELTVVATAAGPPLLATPDIPTAAGEHA